MLKSKDKMLEKLYFHMLPVQILIFAMGSVNYIIDGAMAGRYIDASTVGVVGLYYSMVNIIGAVSSVLVGGSAVLCGRFMGRGDMEKTKGVFSLNLMLSLIIGGGLTFISFAFPGQLSVVLGSNEALKGSLVAYIRGYAFGILPMILSQQLALFLQFERQDKRGYAGIIGMSLSNITLDIVLVGILRMGVFGLALATSLSNIFYFLILVPYYFTKKAQLGFDVKKVLWRLTSELVKIGLPGALLVFCLALRGVTINRILLKYAGSDGLSAQASFSMVCGIIIAYCLGNGAVVRILVSVFVGEEDRDSIKEVLRTVGTKGMLLSVVVSAILFMISPTLARIFFPDVTSNVYHLAYQMFVIYAICVPLILLCQVNTNYLQAMGHNKFVNFLSVFDGYFAMVIPAAILAPRMGAFGVWIANVVGIVLTLLTVPVYCRIFLKHFPRSVDDFLFFTEDFGVSAENALMIRIDNMEAVTIASSEIQEFCEAHDIGRRPAYYSALCLEELAGNVIKHGFEQDKKKHFLTVRTIYAGDRIILRIKDDCLPFDPGEIAEMVKEENGMGSYDNIGIRMVYQVADEVNYQNLLGLNVLTITIKEHNAFLEEDLDYLLERTLSRQDPGLHRRFKDTIVALGGLLSKYQLLFPDYTDHTELHSLTVIDSCNRFIGQDEIKKLNKDEIYILLMACYLHDVGMGVDEKIYHEFKDRFGEKAYFEAHPDAKIQDFIRSYHQEFSGVFIDKYEQFFDFPSPEYAFAVKQVARGHRKTDLFDEKEYPSAYPLPNGNTVCLPYLSALIRLADEIDILDSRNPSLLYDIGSLTDYIDILYHKRHQAVKSMKMTGKAFVVTAQTDEEDVKEALESMTEAMQKTLDLCRAVILQRTDHKFAQEKVILHME